MEHPIPKRMGGYPNGAQISYLFTKKLTSKDCEEGLRFDGKGPKFIREIHPDRYGKNN